VLFAVAELLVDVCYAHGQYYKKYVSVLVKQNSVETQKSRKRQNVGHGTGRRSSVCERVILQPLTELSQGADGKVQLMY